MREAKGPNCARCCRCVTFEVAPLVLEVDHRAILEELAVLQIKGIIVGTNKEKGGMT